MEYITKQPDKWRNIMSAVFVVVCIIIFIIGMILIITGQDNKLPYKLLVWAVTVSSLVVPVVIYLPPLIPNDNVPGVTPAPHPQYATIRGEQFSTSLTSLNLSLSGLQNEDIVPLRYMTYLTTLELWGSQISDLTPLSNLTYLTLLFLDGSQISDLAPLSSLKNLTNLYLWHSQISDLIPLSNLTYLTTLGLVDNQISDWTPVAHVSRVHGRP